MDASAPFDTDVLIIGSGPTGATAALALATYGVKAHMVSRSNWLADTPRAHITNQRTMEVLRDLGIEDEAVQYATPWAQMGDTLFTTSLVGDELVRLRTWGTGEERIGDYLQGSPCGLQDIPQPMIEPVIFKNAAERGARFSFNTEYLGHVQDADGVTVVERGKAASLLPLAAQKVADETQRIADIKSRKALRPSWLDGALRAAGVIKEGETL